MIIGAQATINDNSEHWQTLDSLNAWNERWRNEPSSRTSDTWPGDSIVAIMNSVGSNSMESRPRTRHSTIVRKYASTSGHLTVTILINNCLNSVLLAFFHNQVTSDQPPLIRNNRNSSRQIQYISAICSDSDLLTLANVSNGNMLIDVHGKKLQQGRL